MEILVSINSVQEAEWVLEAGVKWIDLKDTSHGALSSLPHKQSQKIIKAIQCADLAYQPVLSATIGDIITSRYELVCLIKSKHHLGINVIKIPYEIILVCADVLEFGSIVQSFVADGGKIIVVFSPDILKKEQNKELRFKRILDALSQIEIFGLMLDTKDKSQSLFEYLTLQELSIFLQLAKQYGYFVGLAGGMQIENLENINQFPVDVVGFRSGVAQNGNRKNVVNRDKLFALMAKAIDVWPDFQLNEPKSKILS